MSQYHLCYWEVLFMLLWLMSNVVVLIKFLLMKLLSCFIVSSLVFHGSSTVRLGEPKQLPKLKLTISTLVRCVVHKSNPIHLVHLVFKYLWKRLIYLRFWLKMVAILNNALNTSRKPFFDFKKCLRCCLAITKLWLDAKITTIRLRKLIYHYVSLKSNHVI